ncbi:uncharacterized protein LOC136078881 [Hydra vulgaris]|uniref:Uncharacterized protein LOC136078881 n=1 Tax=Hydra vulgaris TaxID=6087 RepID=A0ABM4BNS9_HYDVU
MWPPRITDDIRQVLVVKGSVQLFSTDDIYLSGTEGYSDLQNMSNVLLTHERSTSHGNAPISYRELATRLQLGNTIDSQHQRMIQAETDHWYAILKRLVCIVQFLGTQGLAFRGTSETVFKENNGNFIKLVESISKFDTVLSEHLRRITAKETHLPYLSKQNEFIVLLSWKVTEHIVCELKKALYYSIILDCTPDLSRTEQMTLVVRFVYAVPGQEVNVRDHFLGFVRVSDTSGQGLTACLLDELSKKGISL